MAFSRTTDRFGRRRRVMMIPADLLEAVEQFQVDGDYDSIQTAAAVLIRMALSAKPEAAIVRAAHKEAFNKAYSYCMKHMTRASAELRRLLELME